MHILITAVDSHEKHGLEGLVIRRETEEKAVLELAGLSVIPVSLD